MRHITIAAIAAGGLVLSTGAALANGGDKCFDKATLTYVDCNPIDWSGWYLGAHAGYDPEMVSGDYLALSYDDLELEGFVAGGQLGFQEQFDNGLLLGLEVDFSGVFGADDSAHLSAVPNVRTNIGIAAELNWLASARVRLGLPQGEWMPYSTGGVALAGYEASAYFRGPSNSDTVDEAVFGAVAGGGLELMLDENWIAGVEGLYYFFDSSHTVAPPIGGTSGNVTFGDVAVGRARLSYKF